VCGDDAANGFAVLAVRGCSSDPAAVNRIVVDANAKPMVLSLETAGVVPPFASEFCDVAIDPALVPIGSYVLEIGRRVGDNSLTQRGIPSIPSRRPLRVPLRHPPPPLVRWDSVRPRPTSEVSRICETQSRVRRSGASGFAGNVRDLSASLREDDTQVITKWTRNRPNANSSAAETAADAAALFDSAQDLLGRCGLRL
jgi:hypothetical protein